VDSTLESIDSCLSPVHQHQLKIVAGISDDQSGYSRARSHVEDTTGDALQSGQKLPSMRNDLGNGKRSEGAHPLSIKKNVDQRA
jgi:hypothetical protein